MAQPCLCTTASTRTRRDEGKEGANEEPLRPHGGSAPPRAELLPGTGGCCPRASAEERMKKHKSDSRLPAANATGTGDKGHVDFRSERASSLC